MLLLVEMKHLKIGLHQYMENKMFIEGLVAVIIPLYNCKNYVTEAIESVLEQNYNNIEIIVVDDCSTDNSFNIVKELSKKNNIIKCYKMEKNSGVAAVRNFAISKTNAQYIAFLDSDDLWHKNKIEKQLEVFKKSNTPLVFTAINMIDENSKEIKSKRKIKTVVNYKYLLTHTPICTSSVIIDRKRFPNVQMPLRKSAEDYSLWLRVLKTGISAIGIDEVLVSYRKTSSSLTAKKSKELKYFFNVQVEDFSISKVKAAYHTLAYAFHAFIKYFL